MRPDRWMKLEELYHAARERDQAEREVFLREACALDDELRRDVESLLRYEDQARDFAESPALEIVARDLAEAQADSILGSQLGSYRVISLLGSGGMGDVYLAEDQSLGRKVALKLLPPGLQQSETARQRFKREAKSAASLDHPFICHIYEIGEAGEMGYIAMELVEGQTLQDRLRQDPLEVEEALRIASEIAEALETAHMHGIVHRDLKPSNIMLRSTGHVKVMDFGLAKRAASDPVGSQKITGMDLTKEGSTIGTIPYMSPEQLRGERVDTRSDIFSFGVMLYEMLAGAHPFLKKSPMETAAAILGEEPASVSLSEDNVSELLHPIVGKMLAKKADQRYQSIHEVRTDLSGLIPALSMRRPGPDRGRRQLNSGRLALIGLTIVVGSALWWLYLRDSGVTPRPSAAAIEYRQVTFLGNIVAGRFGGAQLSPDGSFLSYTVPDQGEMALCVQDLTGGRPLVIFKGQTFYAVRWSPDSARLLFTGRDSSGEPVCALIPRLGGEIRTMPWFPLVAWSPDGKRFAGTHNSRSRIGIVNISDCEVEGNFELEGDYLFVRGLDWSPRGDLLLINTLSQDQQHIWLVSTDGSEQKQVYASEAVSDARWSSSAQAIYFLGADRSGAKTADDLWKLAITAAEEPSEPVRLITGGEMAGPLSISATGATLSYVRRQQWGHYWLGDIRDGGIEDARRLTQGNQWRRYGSMSPEGEALAFCQYDPQTRALNLFVMSIQEAAARQVTFMDCDVHHPAWSPDGNWIAFASNCEGGTRVWRVPARGGAPEPFQKTRSGQELYWAPSREILYIRPGNNNFVILDPETEEETLLVQDDSAGWTFDAHPSPDGMKLAFFWNRRDGAADGIYLVNRWDGTASLLSEVDAYPRGWSPDGKWVYASKSSDNEYSESSWVKVSVADGMIEPLAVPPESSLLAGITMDGKQAVYRTLESRSDVWLVENFDPDTALPVDQ